MVSRSLSTLAENFLPRLRPSQSSAYRNRHYFIDMPVAPAMVGVGHLEYTLGSALNPLGPSGCLVSMCCSRGIMGYFSSYFHPPLHQCTCYIVVVCHTMLIYIGYTLIRVGLERFLRWSQLLWFPSGTSQFFFCCVIFITFGHWSPRAWLLQSSQPSKNSGLYVFSMTTKSHDHWMNIAWDGHLHVSILGVCFIGHFY